MFIPTWFIVVFVILLLFRDATSEQLVSLFWLVGCLIKWLFLVFLFVFGFLWLYDYLTKATLKELCIICGLVAFAFLLIPIYKFLDKKTLAIKKQIKEKQTQKRKKHKIITRIKAYKRLLNWRKIRKNKSFEDSFLNKGIYKR